MDLSVCAQSVVEILIPVECTGTPVPQCRRVIPEWSVYVEQKAVNMSQNDLVELCVANLNVDQH